MRVFFETIVGELHVGEYRTDQKQKIRAIDELYLWALAKSKKNMANKCSNTMIDKIYIKKTQKLWCA